MENPAKIRLYVFSFSSVISSALALFFNKSEKFSVRHGSDSKVLLQEDLKNRDLDVLLIHEEPVTNQTFSLIESVRTLARSKKLAIAVLGAYKNDLDILKLIKLDVSGVFHTGMKIEDLNFYIPNLARGVPFYSTKLLAPLLKSLVLENEDLLLKATSSKIDHLTDQEIRILKCICEGLSIKDISETLFISRSTVKNHLSSIYKKLSVKNRTQALLAAMQLGLYSPN